MNFDMARIVGLGLGLCLLGPHASRGGFTLSVDGRSNIFGAGSATAPDPGGNAGVGYGGGLLPPGSGFAAGSNQILTFSSVTGTVSIDSRSQPYNGADGGTSYSSTKVTSYGGISGIEDDHKTMFLIGVFETAAGPGTTAPAMLDFTNGENFAQLAPALDQTFFVGDGLTGTGSGNVQQFLVPLGATMLYLGFADSFDGSTITGQPGYYDDNGGSLTATFNISQASPVPEPSSLVSALIAAGSILGFVASRRRPTASRQAAGARA